MLVVGLLVLMGRLDMAMSLTLAEEMDDVLTRGSDWGYPVRGCVRIMGREMCRCRQMCSGHSSRQLLCSRWHVSLVHSDLFSRCRDCRGRLLHMVTWRREVMNRVGVRHGLLEGREIFSN